MLCVGRGGDEHEAVPGVRLILQKTRPLQKKPPTRVFKERRGTIYHLKEVLNNTVVLCKIHNNVQVCVFVGRGCDEHESVPGV
jgi:hypothetical protein